MRAMNWKPHLPEIFLGISPARHGIVKNIETFNPIRIALHEWLAIVRDVTAARSPRGRLRVFV
jgi:hypothetical protein